MTKCLLEVSKLCKSYDGQEVVRDLSFELKSGQLLCLLGPSGCGKTTVLNCIGGFVTPDSGSIRLRGQEILNLAPERRPVATVFQSYGLFPQMRVAENIAYGLKIRQLPRAQREARVAEMIELLGLQGLEERYPSELSGGQQQRVALARSLILEPALLLLDEPLSNLDAKLRIELREKIRELQQSLGLAMIFVTHDQEEAFIIADQILLMAEGEIVQAASPETLYQSPENPFALSFIGSSNREGDCYLRYENVRFWPRGTERPSDLQEGVEISSGTVAAVNFRGRFYEYRLKVDRNPDLPLYSLQLAGEKRALPVGTAVEVYLPWQRI